MRLAIARTRTFVGKIWEAPGKAMHSPHTRSVLLYNGRANGGHGNAVAGSRPNLRGDTGFGMGRLEILPARLFSGAPNRRQRMARSRTHHEAGRDQRRAPRRPPPPRARD